MKFKKYTIVSLFLLFILLITSTSVSYAQEENINIEEIITQLENNPQALEKINENIDNIEIPKSIGKMIGNEKINLNINNKEGDQKWFNIIIEKGSVVGMAVGYNEEATIEVDIEEEAIQQAIDSEGNPEVIKKIINEGVEYRGLTFGAKIKLFFVKIVQKITFIFV